MIQGLIEERPWGEYVVLVDTPTHKVKSIRVKAGHRISLQRHKYRDEHWTIVQGNARIICAIGEALRPFDRGPGDVVTIPAGFTHRIEALDEDVMFIEVQLGTYFGEDDIERLEDDFGRVD